MTRLDTLKSLQKRIREATGPDRELDARIYGFATNKIPRDPFWRARFGIGRWEFDCIDERGIRASVDNKCVPNFTTDPDGLGACVALCREVLPGALWSVWSMEHGPGCRLLVPGKSGAYHDGHYVETYHLGDWIAPTVCAALLDCIIAAKVAELEAEQVKEGV